MKNKLFLIIAALLFSFFISCTKEDKEAGGSTEAGNSIAVVDKVVAGVTQKGPLINGSKVQVFELENGTLIQTGNSFKGSVTGDKGDFSVAHINLNSRYALLEATGAFYSELTGKISSATVTLNALSDLSDRDNVNINLLTHMEYERVLWLIHNDSMTVRKAKKQAREEVLEAFAGDADNTEFEDMDIFGESEADAMLLAISVMMQLGKSETEFTKALADFVTDIQEDGSWDDAEAMADVADNSFEADLEAIRKNILSWKISDEVPAFESIIENFWNTVFELGKCTADKEGDVSTNTNKESKYYKKDFVCKKKHWILNEPADEGDSDASSSSVNGSSSSSVNGSSSSSVIPSSSSSVIPSSSSCHSGLEPESQCFLDTLDNAGALDCANSMYCPKNCMNVWDSKKGRLCSRVNTELDDGTDSFGFIWTANDDGTTLEWPAGDNGYGVEAASRDKYGYLYGIATLGDENPYAMVGFNVSGKLLEGNDITEWGGLCVVYTASGDLYLTLRYADKETANKQVKLPATKALVVANAAWEMFSATQDADAQDSTNNETVSKDVSQVDIRTIEPGATISFKIHAIGKLGSCNQ